MPTMSWRWGWCVFALVVFALAIVVRPVRLLLIIVGALLMSRVPRVVPTTYITLGRRSIDFTGGFVRAIPFASIANVNRTSGGLVIVETNGRTTNVPMGALKEIFVCHAVARVALVRTTIVRRAEQLAFEAMLAHDTEAAIVRKRRVFTCTIEEARTLPAHVRVFVRDGLTSSYRTAHEPRFVPIDTTG